jgi:invasion protein IalB
MRFFLSFLFALLLGAAGIAFMTMSSAEQGGWGLSLSMPGKDPAIAPDTPTPQESIELAQASQPQAVPTATGVPPQQMTGEPIGDWLFNCATNPQTSARRCSIVQRILNNQSNSVVFAWVIGNDDQGNLVAVWQTPTGVLINRGVAIDVGTEKPIAVPYTACITGHCEAVATLAPDFVETLIKAEKATATIIAVSGQGLTFDLSVKGLSDGIAALKKATVDG